MIIPGMKRPFSQSDVINPGEYATSFSRAAEASDALTATEMPGMAIISGMRTAAADLFGDAVDKDKAVGIYSQYGIDPTPDMLEGDLTFQGVSRRANIMREQRDNQMRLARARSSTALTTRNIAVGFGMQFLDPVNYATTSLAFMAAPAFVASITTGGVKAGKVAQAGKVALRYNRAKAAQAGTAAAFGRGAVEGLAGNALIEIPLNPLLNYTGYDYSLTDSLLSIAMGAPFGGVVHAAPKVFRAYRGKIHNKKLAAIKDSLPDDLRSIADADISDAEIMDMPSIASRGAVQDDIAALLDEAKASGIDTEGADFGLSKPDPIMQKAAEIKANLQRIELTTKAATQRTEVKSLLGYEPESLSQFVRRTGGIKAAAGEFEGRDIRKFGKGAAGLIADGDKAEIDAVKQRVFDAGYFPEKNNYDEISESELYDAIAKDANESNLIKRVYNKEVSFDLATALESDESRYADKLARVGIAADMDVADIAAVLREADARAAEQSAINESLSDVVAKSDDAAEMIQAVSPDTRFAAHAAAVSQMANGNRVNIEPILAMDSRSGLPRPTGDDIARAMEDNIDEDYLRAYDEMPDGMREGEYADEEYVAKLQAAAQEREASADIPFTPPSVADVKSAVRKSFGKHTDKIMDAARIKVVQSADEVFTPDNLPKLPKNIAGAKPRYGYGSKQFTLVFESDIDKAIYTVGNVALDKETGQLKRSKSHAEYVKFLAANGITEADAREFHKVLKDKIKASAKDLEAGELIVKSETAGFYSKDKGGIAGVKMADGTVYLVADNIDPRVNIQGLVLHEIGVHVGMRQMLGDAQFARMLNDVMTSDNPRVRQARERVPSDTPPEHIAEETLAYLVEYAPHDDFVGNVIGAIKAWLMRNFGMKFSVDEFTARHLAIGALRRVSKLGDVGGTMFSREATDIIKYDNPGGAWLEQKRKYAEEDYGPRNLINGPVTAFARDIEIPTDFLKNIKGSVGEVRVKGEAQYDALMKRVKKEGFKNDSPILVGINHRGEAYIIEGNTRAAVARDMGIKAIPAEVRWYAGGEQIDGVLTPAKLESLVLPKAEKTAAGDQFILPGAEKISDKQLAERKMDEALKAKKPQREMDIGMFGDSAKQTTLFSRAKKPEKLEAQPKLADVVKLQDDMLREAEKYKPAIADAIKFLGDDAGMRKRLEQGGVQRDMLQLIVDTANEQNRLITSDMRRQIKAMKAEDNIAQLTPEMEMHAEQIQAALREKILRDKQNAIRNFVAQNNGTARALGFGESFAYEGINSLLAGSSMLRAGARDNIASIQKNYERAWVATIESAMKREGVWELFTKNVHERDVAKALERMDDKKPDFSGINKDAIKIAIIAYKVRENARMTQNSFGANIKQFKNYITRQSHDQNKVYNSTFKEWYDYIKPRLDLVQMGLRDSEAEDALRVVYNEIASGRYEVEVPSEPSLADYIAGANIAERAAKSRTLIFKRDQWFDYNKKYGTNTLAAALFKTLQKSARDAALMRVLGTNPQYNLDVIIDRVGNHLTKVDARAARAFTSGKQERLRDLLAVLDGRANIPGDVMLAKIDTNLRFLQTQAKLGGSTITSMADIGVYAANTRYEGRGNMFQGIADAVTSIFRKYGSGANREILDGLGIVFDHTIADVIHQFSKYGTFTDNMAAATRHYTKFNLQVPWTTRLQKGAAIGLSNYLAKSGDKSFDRLSDEIRRMFKVHNINGAKWDVIRKAIGEAEDGRVFIDTRMIERMDDATIAKYIQEIGRTASPASIEKARAAIAADMRAMFIDRAESAVLSSDARVQAAMIGSSKPGTFWGIMVRQIGQFKGFPLMLWERVLKREVYGRGYDTMSDYWSRGKGDMVGFANFIVTMTALGYISMSIKDVIAQKEPRALDRPGTWIEAMRRGGALGLYGDFMLQEYDRHAGAGLAESILGPSFGAAGDIAEIVTAAVNGDKFATKALRTLQNNTPGANLFYVKPALDNLIMWNLYEAMSPGFLRRSEQNTKQRSGQSYLIPPSQSALRY